MSDLSADDLLAEIQRTASRKKKLSKSKKTELEKIIADIRAINPDRKLTRQSRRGIRNKYRLWIKFKRKCFYCGNLISFEEVTKDHFVASSQGGSNKESNIVCACAGCNSKKGNKDPNIFITEFSKMRLCLSQVDNHGLVWNTKVRSEISRYYNWTLHGRNGPAFSKGSMKDPDSYHVWYWYGVWSFTNSDPIRIHIMKILDDMIQCFPMTQFNVISRTTRLGILATKIIDYLERYYKSPFGWQEGYYKYIQEICKQIRDTCQGNGWKQYEWVVSSKVVPNLLRELLLINVTKDDVFRFNHEFHRLKMKSTRQSDHLYFEGTE